MVGSPGSAVGASKTGASAAGASSSEEVAAASSDVGVATTTTVCTSTGCAVGSVVTAVSSSEAPDAPQAVINIESNNIHKAVRNRFIP
jgi:hypothetical protein